MCNRYDFVNNNQIISLRNRTQNAILSEAFLSSTFKTSQILCDNMAPDTGARSAIIATFKRDLKRIILVVPYELFFPRRIFLILDFVHPPNFENEECGKAAEAAFLNPYSAISNQPRCCACNTNSHWCELSFMAQKHGNCI